METEVELRSLRRQLRLTQSLLALAMITGAAVLVLQGRQPSQIAIGESRVRSTSIDVGSSKLEWDALTIAGIKGATAELRADAGGAALAMSSGTAGFVHYVDRESRRAAVVARGDVVTELRFDTRTGAVLLVQNTDPSGAKATERVIQLAPPLRQ